MACRHLIFPPLVLVGTQAVPVLTFGLPLMHVSFECMVASLWWQPGLLLGWPPLEELTVCKTTVLYVTKVKDSNPSPLLSSNTNASNNKEF